MKLTENELNYILSETIQSTLLENEPKPLIKTNMIGGVKGVKSDNNDTTAQKNKKRWYQIDKTDIKGLASAAASAAGGLAIADGLSGAGLTDPYGFGLAALGGLLIGGVMGGIIVDMGKGVSNFFKLRNKGIPRNIKSAFKVACKAAVEYKNAAALCKIIQTNWNNALQAYNTLAPRNNWQPQNLTWKSPEIQNQITSDFTLSKGAIAGTKGRVNVNQNFNNLQVNESANAPDFKRIISPKEISYFLSNFDNTNAVKAMAEIAQLYSEAYKIYFEWKSYLAAIGQKFGITWNEINNGKMNKNNSKFKGQVNTNLLSNIGETITLEPVSIKTNYGNNVYYAIFKEVGNDNVYYGINYNYLNGATNILNHLQNNGRFEIEIDGTTFVPSDDKNSIQYNRKNVLILSVNGVNKLEPIQGLNQQSSQGQQQTQNQQQRQPLQGQGQNQQSNPYGNYGGGWSSSSTY